MRSRLPTLLLFASIALTVHGTASAQAPGVVASLTTDAADLTVGDPVTLNLRVVHPPGYQVTFPLLPGTWGDFEIRGQSPAQTVDNLDGTQTTGQSLEAALFTPGEFTTPDVEIMIRDSAGQTHEESVRGASVMVASVLGEGDEEPRDIRPQAQTSEPLIGTLTTWLIVGSTLAALVGAGVYLLIGRRRPHTVVQVDTRSPRQIALEELHRIEALDLPAQSRFKEHYTLVSDCVRSYLERAFHTPALDRTTTEVRAALKIYDVTAGHAEAAVRLLEDSDLVKFTKLAPESEEARASTTRARGFVTMTAPPETEAPEGVGA